MFCEMASSGIGCSNNTGVLAETLGVTCASHVAFCRASGRDSSRLFGVKHFAGQVFYEAADFVRKNASAHRPDICAFLREHGGDFVREMLSDDARDAVPRRGRKLFGRTLIDIFQQELNELCSTLEARDCRHIRCLRPNDEQKPLVFDDASMLRQCRYSGLLEATRIRRQGFAHRRSLTNFAARYASLLVSPEARKEARSHAKDLTASCKAISEVATAGGVSAEDVRIGHSKVFMREPALAWLEGKRSALAQLLLSTALRGHVLRRRFLQLRRNILRLQAMMRGAAARRRAASLRQRLAEERAIQLAAQQEAAAQARALIREDAAVQLQSYWRSRRARGECNAMRTASAEPLQREWPVRVEVSPLQEARQVDELEASSNSLPPRSLCRRHVGEVRVCVPTCRQGKSRPLAYHEIVAGTPRISREQESTTSVPSRQTDHLKVSLPLKTRGKRIVDTSNNTVRLRCVNWYGAHMQDMVALGFNCVRLPYSLEMHLDEADRRPGAKVLAANPQFLNMSVMQIFDATIHALEEARIMVILNNHQGKAMWCCSEDDGEGLWYRPPWAMAAMTGAEKGHYLWPQWTAVSEGTANWAAAALRAAVMVLEERGCQRGVVYEVHDYCWYHTNFFRAWQLHWLSIGWLILGLFDLRRGKSKVGFTSDMNHENPGTAAPGLAKKLILLSLTAAVISHWMTSYSWFQNKLDHRWGYILHANEAPIWLGEFGTNGYWTTAVWADVEVDPDRSVIFLRRAAESQLKRPLKALLSAQGQTFVQSRLNGPSRICDAGLQDGDVITAIVREPGPVMESYRKATGAGNRPDGAVFTQRNLGMWAARAFAAIKEDTVVTWGASEFGGDSRSVRKQLTDVMQVYVSEFACAAIRNDGTVVSWGSAIAGGDSHDVRSKLIDVKEIVATNSAFAAIKSDGSVVAWGDARNGGSCEEVQEELFDVEKIFASNTAFAAIRGDGKVVTWGAKNGGGDSQAWLCKLEAVQSQLLDVRQIHSTSVAFAAVRQDGSVVAWGAVSGGGDCSGQELTDASICRDVVQMHSTTRAFAALQADGKVLTWGAASEVPQALVVTAVLFMTISRMWYSSVPVKLRLPLSRQMEVSLRRGVRQLVATDSAFAAIKDDASVVTWGAKRAIRGSADLMDVQQVVPNEGAFAAIKSDGSVVTWGDPAFGGDSSEVQAELVNVHRIHAASGAFAAVRHDGKVISWGDPRGPCVPSNCTARRCSECSNTKDCCCTFAVKDAEGSVQQDQIYIINLEPTK
eukprot:s1132_g3.t1